MIRHLCSFAAAALLLATLVAPPALAQKQGGILREYIIGGPASMSIHEESTVVAERPMMAVMHRWAIAGTDPVAEVSPPTFHLCTRHFKYAPFQVPASGKSGGRSGTVLSLPCVRPRVH
jgi:hypothetical protein